jgi:hypothetical protein
MFFGVFFEGKIVATVDGTTISENGSLKSTLNAGEVYSCYFAGDGTGKHITSSHPVAYYVTNACTNVPQSVSFCDCLYQQMAPVNAWGNNFLVPTNGGCFISSDKPVAVTAYLTGSQYVSPNKGDPAMAWVPPVEQMIAGTAIAPFAPGSATSLNEHYALVVTPTATRSQTTVAIGASSPAALSGGSWTAGSGTAGSAYSFYAMPLADINSSYYFYNPNGLTVMGL